MTHRSVIRILALTEILFLVLGQKLPMEVIGPLTMYYIFLANCLLMSYHGG